MKTSVTDKLFALQDLKYRDFQAPLVPNISKDTIIGVRLPLIRKLAKEINIEDKEAFLHSLPHKYYDENLLHSILLSGIKDYDLLIEELDRFLPYVDNWAVCDTLLPKIKKNDTARFLKDVYRWTASKDLYTCRFGIRMLMNYFLEEDFEPKYLETVAEIKTEEYYLQMMVAWYFATALAKQWEATFPYISNNRLDKWIHNKTIQKARESFRITEEQKEILKGYKR